MHIHIFYVRVHFAFPCIPVKIFLDVFEPVHCCGIFGFKFRRVHSGIALYVVNAHLDGSRKSALVVAFHS